jgi:hypothetical protein
VLLPIRCNAFSDDVGRVADRFRGRQDLEVGLGKIGQRIEIVHLAVHIKEGMLGAVAQRGASHDHTSGVASLAVDAVGCARCAAEGPQVSEGITQLRFSAGESQKQD